MFSFDTPPYRETVLLNCNGSYLGRHEKAPASCP
jgi:hypothetical protein